MCSYAGAVQFINGGFMKIMRKVLILTAAMMLGLTGCGTANSDSPAGGTSEAGGTDVSQSATDSPQAVSNEVMYQLTDYSQMMGYVIRTRHGKLIVIDGGYDRDADSLIDLARELTGSDVPEIDAWLLSHPHMDHVDAFSEIISKRPGTLSVKNVLYNLPEHSYVLEHGDPGSDVTYDKLTAALDTLDASQKTVVQQGDSFDIDGISIEVLLVPDNSPDVVKGAAINESSVIYRLTIAGQRVLFLGDAYTRSDQRLRQAYGKDLVSDIVQMAHHGSNGVNRSLYKLISPKACLWPTPDWLWNNDQGGGYDTGPWETVKLYEYMRDQVGVKYHYVAKDGVIRLEFPLDLE